MKRFTPSERAPIRRPADPGGTMCWPCCSRALKQHVLFACMMHLLGHHTIFCSLAKLGKFSSRTACYNAHCELSRSYTTAKCLPPFRRCYESWERNQPTRLSLGPEAIGLSSSCVLAAASYTSKAQKLSFIAIDGSIRGIILMCLPRMV